MFGLTTTAKLRAAEEAALQMRIERDNARAARDAATQRAEAEKNRAVKSGRLASELLTERDAAHDKLREIVAAETPACAGIGRKMARIAREGLPEFAVPTEQEAA